MRLLLIRHGRTSWNVERRVQGRTDIPLCDEGVSQARAVAERLIPDRIDVIYTSPLMRAYDTAREIAKHQNCELIAENDLTEIDFGPWQGVKADTLQTEHPSAWDAWCNRPDEFHIAGAETAAEVYERSLEALERIWDENPQDASVCIVSHTLPIKLLVAGCIGLPMGRIHNIRIDNCGLTEIELKNDGKGILIQMNETDYLRDRGLL